MDDSLYKKYRGKCKEYSEKAVKEDPTLTLVRGHYWDFHWGNQPHWWTTRPDGSIYDPTKLQFPSRGTGDYIPFDGYVECANCGKEIIEDDCMTYGNYGFCSSECACRFVGL